MMNSLSYLGKTSTSLKKNTFSTQNRQQSLNEVKSGNHAARLSRRHQILSLSKFSKYFFLAFFLLR